jgi:hypothetical protein
MDCKFQNQKTRRLRTITLSTELKMRNKSRNTPKEGRKTQKRLRKRRRTTALNGMRNHDKEGLGSVKAPKKE